jgi:hypothetical protein
MRKLMLLFEALSSVEDVEQWLPFSDLDMKRPNAGPSWA